MKLSRIAFVFGALVLAGGLLVSVTKRHSGELTIRPDLVSDLPMEIVDWQGTDQPIADTPEMKDAVVEMLNYDDAIFRNYTNGSRTLSVYAAYWGPGKFHPRLISIHTPDVCWKSNGMIPMDANYNYALSVMGSPLWHAQYREFDAGGKPIYVIYWHILNGLLSGYAEGPNSSSRQFVDNLWRDMSEGIGQQYFIRISSSTPFDYWKNEPVFQEVLKHFAPVLSQNVISD